MKKINAKLEPCDICKSTEAIEVPYCRNYTNNQALHICKKCGLVHRKKRRSYREIADTWSHEIFGDELNEFKYTGVNPWCKGRLTFVTEFIDEKLGLKGKKVCDIGAGEGVFLNMAKAKGAQVFGIEPSPANCKLLKKDNIEYFNGPIEIYDKTPKKGYKADISTMMWTLECCQSPNNMLKGAYNLLKEGGYAVWAGGSRILVPFKKPLHMYFSSNYQDTHPLHLSFNTLKALFAVNGFEVTHHNQFIDNDIMIVIAQKKKKGAEIPWKGDDYVKVADFFERWHKESLHYR